MFSLKEDTSNSKAAISQVIDEVFVRHDMKFDIVMLGQPSKSSSVTISEILKRNLFDIEVIKVTDLKAWTGNAALVLVTPTLDFMDFLNTYNNTQSKLLFLVHKFLKFDESNYISSNPTNSNNLVIFNSRTKLELKTFQRWSEKSCELKYLLTLNIYNKISKKWKNDLKIPENFSNFNGCPLKIFSGIYRLPTLDIIDDLGMAHLHWGIAENFKRRNRKEKEILDIFEEFGNFKAIRRMKKFDRDLDVSQFAWPKEHGLSCGTSVLQYTIVVMSSKTEPYTNFEKMILPFDDMTWFYLILVFCSAFIGILIINQTPKSFKDLVYGNGVKMPSFNVIGTLFGIGQTKLPDNNFGRIILMTFILFCLIFRTAYQGVFFEMFTSDLRRRPPASFADLKERNYTLYNAKTEHYSYDITEYIDQSECPRQMYVNMYEMYEIFLKMSDTSSKSAIPTSKVDYRIIESGYGYGFENIPAILKEEINFPPHSICVHENSFFSHISHKISNALITSGIIKYWFDYLINFELPRPVIPPPEPKIFEVDDLSFGFYIWFVACGISGVAFSFEIFYFITKRKLLRLSKKCIALYFVVRFLNNKGFM